MRPKTIMHNAVSLDGSVKGFEVDMGQYYGILMGYKPGAILVGSNTVKEAHDNIPPEEKSDFQKREIIKSDKRPFWVIVDTKGVLKGILHFYRRMEYIKEIIMVVSESTPDAYIEYLKERNYNMIKAGDNHADLNKVLEELSSRYGVKTAATDSGGILNCALLERDLIDEISLLVVPVLTGNNELRLFRSLSKNLSLELFKNKRLENGCLHLRYNVKGQ